MEYGLFSIYDKKLCAYMQPYFSANTATALRAFSDACKDTETMLAQHPEDFQLCKIGDYDDQTGNIEGHPVISIMEASSDAELKEVAK